MNSAMENLQSALEPIGEEILRNIRDEESEDESSAEENTDDATENTETEDN